MAMESKVTLRGAMVLGFLCFASVGSAQVPPAWDFQLNVRTGPDGGYNLNGLFSVSSATPSINSDGTIAIKGLNAAAQWGVWRGSPGFGQFVVHASDSMGDPFNAGDGRILFGSTMPTGLYQVAPGASVTSLLTSGPSGTTSWANPAATASGLVGFRSGGSVNALTTYAMGTGTFTTWAQQGSDDIGFLYSAAQFNSAGEFATKVDLASGGSAIRHYTAPGVRTTIATAGGAFQSFFNNIGFGANGHVAFNANLGGGNRGVYLWNGSSILPIATSLDTEVRPTESFNMAVHEGLVYFRAFDSSNRRAIWVGDGSMLARVVTEGDLVATPQGTFRIGFAGSGPAFSASPTINEFGQLAFAAPLLDPTTGADRGIGVFTATPVPEPWTLLALGLGAVAAARRRRRKL
jgi:hypothetical protein